VVACRLLPLKQKWTSTERNEKRNGWNNKLGMTFLIKERYMHIYRCWTFSFWHNLRPNSDKIMNQDNSLSWEKFDIVHANFSPFIHFEENMAKHLLWRLLMSASGLLLTSFTKEYYELIQLRYKPQLYHPLYFKCSQKLSCGNVMFPSVPALARNTLCLLLATFCKVPACSLLNQVSSSSIFF
jgi:hypothetical protein